MGFVDSGPKKGFPPFLRSTAMQDANKAENLSPVAGATGARSVSGAAIHSPRNVGYGVKPHLIRDGAFYMDCAALAKRYRMKSPSPGMREVRLLPKVGFKIEALCFIGGVIEKRGRIDELAEFIVSHDDRELLLAIKVFASACTLGGRDYFNRLDFRLLAHDAPRPYKPPLDETTAMVEMKDVIYQERFDSIAASDKEFILAFDKEMLGLGYAFGGSAVPGYVWGTSMIVWSKIGVKATQVAARVYVRDNAIVLRRYFSNIDKHRAYIENAPRHIKDAFTGSHGDCGCNPKKVNCNFRKTYTIDGRLIEKCSGVAFEFQGPDLVKLPDYVGLLKEFYADKRKTNKED
jgi:hypothetical protein